MSPHLSLSHLRRLLVLIAVLAGVAVVPASSVVEAGPTTWETGVEVSAGVVAPGGDVALELEVVAPTDATTLIDIEIYDAAGRKVHQAYWDNQSFRAGRGRDYDTTWQVLPGQAHGAYRVMVGVFQPGWAGLLAWNSLAATVIVGPGSSTPTTASSQPVPTTEPPTTTAPAATTTTRPPTTTAPAGTTTQAPTTTTATTSPATSPPSGGQFVETFQTAAGLSRFDWELHTSEPVMDVWQGEHNQACEGPTTYRPIAGQERHGSRVDVSATDLVYWCSPGNPDNGHVMTSVDTLRVAVLSFSPKQTFDNVSEVCWDQNMNNLGEGKWTSLFIVPAAHAAANGLHYASGIFGGDPSELTLPAGGFSLTWLRGTFLSFRGTADSGGPDTYQEIFEQWGSTPDNMQASPGPRLPMCVRDLGNNQLQYRVYQTGRASVITYTSAGSFPDGPVRVVWQDGSYDPIKHAGTGNLTWHWDNISVS